MSDTAPSLDIEQIFLAIYKLLVTVWEQFFNIDPTVFFFDNLVRIGIISSFLTPALLALIVYVVIRNRQMLTAEFETYREKSKMPHLAEGSPRSEQWQKIEEQISSDRPSDWRIGILEADVILDELLISLGYQGENLGDRLKSVDRGDMRTLDMAWEAHKLRNEIAHGGSDFVLTQRAARQAFEQFRQVFEEFDYI